MKGNKKTFLFPICFFDWQIMTCLCNSNTEYLVFCYLKFAASFSDSAPKHISVQTVDWETKNELNNSLCAMLLCCWYRKGGAYPFVEKDTMNVVCILNGSCHVVVVQSCVNNSMSRATVLVSPFDGGAVAMLFIDFAQELQFCRERSNMNQTLQFQSWLPL